jgi:hypothetical protein
MADDSLARPKRYDRFAGSSRVRTPPMRSLAVLFLPLVASCASTRQPPLAAPEVEAGLRYHAGDPIGGAPGLAEVEALELAAADALRVRGRLHVVDERPGERLEPLTDHVRLIVGEGGADPLAPSAQLFTGARLATGDEARDFARDVAGRPRTEAVLAATFEGLVLPGLTTTMSVAHVQPIELAGHLPTERRLSVELWREDPADPSVSIALVVSDVVETVEGLAEATPVVARRPRREKLVLDARIRGPEGSVALFAPAQFDPDGRLAYVLVLEADAPPGADEHADLESEVAAALAEAREGATLGAESRERLDLADRQRVRRLRALDALGDERHRRAALVELAGHAPIAGELAIAGDEETVTALCTVLGGRAEELRGLASDEGALAWALEREAVRLLVDAQSEEDLAPEHAGLLLRHSGEAGRYPGALEDALAASADLATFHARILEENRIALEDSSPAARVRAYDWLTAQGLEVPEYDPLSDPRARRAALRAWADAEATQAAEAAAATGTASTGAPTSERDP